MSNRVIIHDPIEMEERDHSFQQEFLELVAEHFGESAQTLAVVIVSGDKAGPVPEDILPDDFEVEGVNDTRLFGNIRDGVLVPRILQELAKKMEEDPSCLVNSLDHSKLN